MATTTQRAKSGRTRSSATQRGSASSRSKAVTQAKPSAPSTKPTTASAKKDSEGMTVRLPFVTAEFHRPDLRLPEIPMPDVRGTVNNVASSVRDNLPSREEVAYFGGLGLLAALSVIEWPVAAAIGVGTVVAQRASGGGGGSRQQSRGRAK